MADIGAAFGLSGAAIRKRMAAIGLTVKKDWPKAPPGSKMCSACREIKPLTEYHKRSHNDTSRSKGATYCKPCALNKSRLRYSERGYVKPNEDRVMYEREPNYKDSGCVLYHSCLSCPLPKCLEEYGAINLASRSTGEPIKQCVEDAVEAGVWLPGFEKYTSKRLEHVGMER